MDKRQPYLEKILNTPGRPLLKLIGKAGEDFFIFESNQTGYGKKTNKRINAKKIADFCYSEEEYLHSLAKLAKSRGIKMTLLEADTRILRYLYPDLQFDAYSFDAVGSGLNMDGLSRVSGGLYKTAP